MKHKQICLEWLLNLLQAVRHKSMSELVAEVHPLNSLGENRRRKTRNDTGKLFLPSYDLIHNLLLLGTPCTVTTDAQMLKRVTDNLLSNIEKYADPAARLTILAEREGERLHVCFANRARRELARVESNHIGLRTCAAILKLLGGEFITHRDGDDFTAEFTLPVTPQSET